MIDYVLLRLYFVSILLHLYLGKKDVHYDDISTTGGKKLRSDNIAGIHPIYSEPEARAIALRPATAAVRFGR